MTATLDPPGARVPPAARRWAVPVAPLAAVLGGLFPDVQGPIKIMRALRAAGTSGDTVGLAVPLPGDPDDPQTMQRLIPPRRRGFDPVGYLMVVLDPHRPPPTFQSLTWGQNVPLTRSLLGDLSNWLAGVKTFRIPAVPSVANGAATGTDGAAGGTDGAATDAEDGVWVLGRPNHAAAVAGAEGGALGGSVGALAAFGVPLDLGVAYAQRIIGGEVLFTTCETDEGRTKRDRKLMRKHGGVDIFERVIVAPHRQQGQVRISPLPDDVAPNTRSAQPGTRKAD